MKWSRWAYVGCLSLGLVSHSFGQATSPVFTPVTPNPEVLGKALKDASYEPKALTAEVFQITVEKDRWPVHVMISYSADGTRIWLESKFAPIEDPDRVPAQAWRRLLEANERIGPAHFAFDNADRRVHLYRSFENTGVDPARLKREVEAFDSIVRKTQEVWRSDNFKPGVSQAVETQSPPLAPVPPIAEKTPPKETPFVPIARPISTEEINFINTKWQIVSIEVQGKKTEGAALAIRNPSLEFRNWKTGITAELVTGPTTTRKVDVKYDVTKDLKEIDFIDSEKGEVERGIYKVVGKELIVCFAPPGDPRPTKFSATEESKTWLIVLSPK